MTTRIEAQADARTTEALLQKARALAPKLRERADATGKARRIPDETIRDFWDAGLWYLLKPKKFGGPELRPDVALSVANELARADGSAGWVWAVMTIHDLLVALWPEEFQKEYWAKNTLSASSFAPTGKATPASGGYNISGKWSFSSGIDNADWLLLGVFFGPPSGGSPIPDIRYVMLPKFVTIKGTFGEPKSDLNELALGGLLLKSGVGIAEKLGVNVGGKTGDAIKGVGNLLTGQKPAATNQPSKNTAPKVNPLDLFKKK